MKPVVGSFGRMMAAVAALWFAVPASAQETATPVAGPTAGQMAQASPTVMPRGAASDPDLVSFGAGYFDVLKNEPRNRAADFRLEYRFGESLLSDIEQYVSIRPWVGAEITSDGGVYGAGGLLFDFEVGSFNFTPSFGAGLHYDGDGKQLGSFWEFRSQAELSYRFDNDSRIGIAFGHISNAGLSKDNPGSEILTLYYHVPSSWLFGW